MSAFPVEASSLLLLAGHLVVASYWDVKERRVPNNVVYFGLLTALVLHALTSGWLGLGAAFVGALTGLVLFLPLNVFRIMGAGDVKLMAMAGAFGGSFQTAMWMVLYTLIAGGLMVVFYVARSEVREKLLHNIVALLRRSSTAFDNGEMADPAKLQPAAKIPYAIAISCGSMGYLLFGLL